MIRLLLQKQSDLGLPCLSRFFWVCHVCLATSVCNFRDIFVFASILDDAYNATMEEAMI